MTLTNMKRSKRDSRGSSAIECDIDANQYPYGLALSLDDESLKKLGIKKLPTVGTQLLVVGMGVVQSASERSTRRGSDRDLTVQLESIEVGPAKEDDAVDAVSAAIKDA